MLVSRAGRAVIPVVLVVLSVGACAGSGSVAAGRPAAAEVHADVHAAIQPAIHARPEPPPPKPKPKPKPVRGPGLSRVVQPGPSSPISPDIDSYFNALRRGDCAQVRDRTVGNGGDVGVLYAALADLCLGYMRASYQVDWPAAEIAYTESAALDDCLSLAARDALRRALARHQATGLARPSFGAAPLGTACDPQPTYVGIVAKEDGTEKTIIVLGLRMFEVTDVKVNGVWQPATGRNAIEGTECARADVPGVEVASGDSLAVRVRGTGYRTQGRQWIVGPVLTEEDVINLDANVCAPTPPDVSSTGQ